MKMGNGYLAETFETMSSLQTHVGHPLMVWRRLRHLIGADTKQHCVKELEGTNWYNNACLSTALV